MPPAPTGARILYGPSRLLAASIFASQWLHPGEPNDRQRLALLLNCRADQEPPAIAARDVAIAVAGQAAIQHILAWNNALGIPGSSFNPALSSTGARRGMAIRSPEQVFGTQTPCTHLVPTTSRIFLHHSVVCVFIGLPPALKQLEANRRSLGNQL